MQHPDVLLLDGAPHLYLDPGDPPRRVLEEEIDLLAGLGPVVEQARLSAAPGNLLADLHQARSSPAGGPRVGGPPRGDPGSRPSEEARRPVSLRRSLGDLTSRLERFVDQAGTVRTRNVAPEKREGPLQVLAGMPLLRTARSSSRSVVARAASRERRRGSAARSSMLVRSRHVPLQNAGGIGAEPGPPPGSPSACRPARESRRGSAARTAPRSSGSTGRGERPGEQGVHESIDDTLDLPWDSGQRVRISILPASDSETLGRTKTFAEPVSRKRPGRRSRSTAALSARNSSGARWTSSRIAGPSSPATNPAGSRVTAASTVASSRVKYWASVAR